MSQTSVDDNSNSNNRTSSETQKSEQTTKTSSETNEVKNNDKSSQQDVEKGKENSDQRSASAERTSNSNSHNEQPSESSSNLLETLCIAEGGLEDTVERAIRKQVDSDLSKIHLFPLNIHIIMVKFSLRCQARILMDENRCLIGIRASEELLERKLSSSSAVPDERRKSSGRVQNSSNEQPIESLSSQAEK